MNDDQVIDQFVGDWMVTGEAEIEDPASVEWFPAPSTKFRVERKKVGGRSVAKFSVISQTPVFSQKEAVEAANYVRDGAGLSGQFRISSTISLQESVVGSDADPTSNKFATMKHNLVFTTSAPPGPIVTFGGWVCIRT